MKWLLVILILSSCNKTPDWNNQGLVKTLPKGIYTIQSTSGSKHPVMKCVKPSGQYFYIRSSDFKQSGYLANNRVVILK